MRKLFEAAWEGIRLAAVVYLLISIALGLVGGAEKFASGYGMATSGIAVILIGFGFGIPTLIYETDLCMWQKILIHMGIGCLVMMGSSILGGWLPMERGFSAVFIALAIEIVIAFLLFGINFLIIAAEAKRLNKKIKEKAKM